MSVTFGIGELFLFIFGLYVLFYCVTKLVDSIIYTVGVKYLGWADFQGRFCDYCNTNHLEAVIKTRIK